MLSKAAPTREQCNQHYDAVEDAEDAEQARWLCLNDLFFLLTRVCKRKDIDKDWLYERCREVEANPDGHLDLWAREHYKSTIITFGKSIQDLLKDPDHTLIGIFSHTRPSAKGFLDQIKRELEGNRFLQQLFPDVLYANPKSEAPKWSLDGGITIKRKTNPKEASVEAWGLVDGQPTGKHFTLMVYDDVVTLESVSTPEQIKKTTAAWEMSSNLGAQGGRKRYIGTRYHLFDTYDEMMKRDVVTPRVKSATVSGEYPGEPVLFTPELLAQKRKEQGPYTFNTQMMQNPVADKAMSFREDWLRYYDKLGDTRDWNFYILGDPASKKKKTSDYTVMAVIGLAPDGNYYLVDAIRDRLNLTQRWSTLVRLHRKWKPKRVGYEEYGLQADIEHFKYMMGQENYRFEVVELGGQVAKEDRIKGLVPKFEQGQIYLPKTLRYVNYENESVDFVEKFKTDEYLAFPVAAHDDMLDCLARMIDPVLGAQFPQYQAPVVEVPRSYDYQDRGQGWMG